MRQDRPSFSHGALIDTSAYFAFADRDDVHRSDAQAVFTRLAESRVRLLTTNLILAETHALILNRLNRLVASRFLHDTLQGSTTILWVTPADVQQAAQIIDQHDDKDFSLTDATSFAVMERLRIGVVFTFDHHFVQYGFSLLTPDRF
ncbi:MAG: PIN domain-containing protein [Dehalococcoidia bacterium]|nr:PIN domain-containing protein [Dehalococcoidia bacterium]